MKPFLNWAGGKRWLVSGYGVLLGVPGSRFIEPFLGSGAVFFHVSPSKALLSDTNKQLIETYSAVRDEPLEVLRILDEHRAAHCATHYYEVRASHPESVAARAAQFIYLNRTCWNGLYRVNLRGEFNVPIGSKTSVVLPDDDFPAWAKVLARATVIAQDFSVTLSEAGAGDVVYADPPYTVQHNMNNFVKYNEKIFSWADQVRLSKCLNAATEQGASVIMSNADSQSIRDLYPAPGWTRLVVARHSRLAASSEHRKKTTELLISNCLSPIGELTLPRVCSN